jgi:hypothetical protein
VTMWAGLGRGIFTPSTLSPLPAPAAPSPKNHPTQPPPSPLYHAVWPTGASLPDWLPSFGAAALGTAACWGSSARSRGMSLRIAHGEGSALAVRAGGVVRVRRALPPRRHPFAWLLPSANM